MNHLFSSTEDPRKGNARYSQPFVPAVQKTVRYSRHLSFQHQRISSNGRSQLVIHARIRSPTNKRRSADNKSLNADHDLHSISTILTARYGQNKANNSDNISNPTEETAPSLARSLSISKSLQRHQSLPNTIYNQSNSNDLIRYFQDQNDKITNSVGGVLQRQQFPSESNKSLTNNNSSLFLDYNSATKQKELWSNTKDFQKDSSRSKTKKRKKYRYLGGCPCSWPCLLASLLTALLLGIAIAAALLAILFKTQTTTTQPTTSAVATTLSTTMATTSSSTVATTASTTVTTSTITTTDTTTSSATTTSTTESTTVSSTITTTIITFAPAATSTTSSAVTTTTESTTSTSRTTTSTTQTTTSTTVTTSTVTTTRTPTTTTTPILCSIPISSIFNYSGPTTQAATCTYTALFTGSATLQFSFESQGAGKIGYLDDVSILDRTASNSEMLINGGFENGTFAGWQQSGTCTGSAGSITSGASCNTGSFCYTDGCKNSMDFLSQTFTTIIGHVYTLSFWVTVHSNQDVFVRIL